MKIGAMNHPAEPIEQEIAWMAELKLDFVDLTLEPPAAATWKIRPAEIRGQGDGRFQHSRNAADRRRPLRQGKDQSVQIRLLEKLWHRKREILKYLGFRAIHAPRQAGDRRTARVGRQQRG